MVIDNNRCKYDIEKKFYILNLFIKACILEIPRRCGAWKVMPVSLSPTDGVFESRSVKKQILHVLIKLFHNIKFI